MIKKKLYNGEVKVYADFIYSSKSNKDWTNITLLIIFYEYF